MFAFQIGSFYLHIFKLTDSFLCHELMSPSKAFFISAAVLLISHFSFDFLLEFSFLSLHYPSVHLLSILSIRAISILITVALNDQFAYYNISVIF